MIKLALYGCGNRTKVLLNSLLKDEFYKVHAAFDVNQESAVKLTAEYGGTVCRSAEELTGFKDVDAFLISLSPFAHADALRKTIPVGKPVFVEKPVSFSGIEVRELSKLAKKYNVPVQVGFMRRYLPPIMAALDYIRRNDPGRLFCIDGTWVHHGDTEMNYNLFHQPDNFRLKVSQIPFHCCHMLDVMLLMGGPVKRVSSQLIKVTERPYPSPDDVCANIEYANGASGRFHYSSMVYYLENSYRFHAEKYSIKLGAGANALEIYSRPRFMTSQLGSFPEKEKDFSRFNANYESSCLPETINFNQPGFAAATENIMYDFVRMVRDGVMPTADLDAAVRVEGLAEAIERSGHEGVSIELGANGLPVD